VNTLSNGYFVPEDGDFGDVWFDAIEANIQRVNDHSHNGVDSARIPSVSVQAVTGAIAVDDFVVQPDGRFRALSTVPAGGNFDTLQVIYRDPTTNEQMYLSYERVSATQFYTYINIVQVVLLVFTS